MAVNGIEIEVGQRWRTRDGQEAVINTGTGAGSFPVIATVAESTEAFTEIGRYLGNDVEHDLDLITLVAQAPAGDSVQSTTFGPDAGINETTEPALLDLKPGAVEVMQPEPTFCAIDAWIKVPGDPMPEGTVVEYRTRDGQTAFHRAGDLDWSQANEPDDIVEYRIVHGVQVDREQADRNRRLRTEGGEVIREPGLTLNPKDAIGSTKLPLHLWPAEATALGCLGMLEGDEKYGRNNYIAANGVICSIYIDAAMRHLQAWFAGEECAPDSGMPHLANALASIAIVVKARAHGKLIDDREYSPLPNGELYRKFIDSITPHVAQVKALFKDKTPKRWTIGDIQVERKKADDTEGGEA